MIVRKKDCLNRNDVDAKFTVWLALVYLDDIASKSKGPVSVY